MNKNLLYGFLKFSKETRYLVDLVERGIVYFNHYSNFTSITSDFSLKFDNSEGAPYHYQPEGIKYFWIGDHKFKLASAFTPHKTPPDLPFIYCLHAITKNSLKRSVGNQIYDPRLWEDFGEYVVLIHNPKEFINRIKYELERTKISLGFDLVEYIESQTYSGKLGIFRKKNIYKYQEEYRFAICPNTDDLFYKIEIGNISDIAVGPKHKDVCLNQLIDETLMI